MYILDDFIQRGRKEPPTSLLPIAVCGFFRQERDYSMFFFHIHHQASFLFLTFLSPKREPRKSGQKFCFPKMPCNTFHGHHLVLCGNSLLNRPGNIQSHCIGDSPPWKVLHGILGKHLHHPSAHKKGNALSHL